LSFEGPASLAWATGVVGIGLGVLVALVGIRWGARLYDQRAPELLAALRRA
jgi:ABC-2 type transport system permease protein